MAIALICSVVLFALMQREPRYQGRTLTAWLADVRFAGTPGASLVAEEAIKAMGTNAIPFLMEMFRTEDTRPTLFAKLRVFVERHTGFTFGIVSADEKRVRAVFGLRALGEAAQSAVAKLSMCLTNSLDGTHSDFPKWSTVMVDFSLIGAEALPFLLARCKIAPQDGAVLSQGIRTIISLDAVSALPKLMKLMSSEDGQIRRWAKDLLCQEWENMDAKTLEPVLPLLVDGLRDEDLEIRGHFLLYVNELGPSAKALAPSVKALLLDEREQLRRLATNTLVVIQPEDNPAQ